MPILFYLLALLIVLSIGIYYYIFFRRLLTLFGIEKGKKKSRILSALLTVVIIAACVSVFSFGPIAILLFLLISLVLEFVHFLLKRIRSGKFQDIWGFIYKSGLLCLVLTIGALAYGYYNMNDVQRTEYDVHTAKAAARGMKIVQISDLHTGISLNDKDMKACFDEIQSEKADLLVLTGDIFDESTTKRQMEMAVRRLSEIKTTYGSYFVYGNHDANLYDQSPAYTQAELEAELKNAGIHVLKDQSAEIRRGVQLIGRKDKSTEDRKTIDVLAEEAGAQNFLLLLDHQPAELEGNAAVGIDLELSGHTHGGQIWPMGLLGKLIGVNEEYYGIHSIGEFQVIVSSGVAGWGFPIRTEGVSEYVVVNIKE